MQTTQEIPGVITEEYPSLLKRFQSSFVDGIVAFSIAGGLMVICNRIDENSAILKIIAAFIAISYEPVMGKYSRTLGQRMTGLRIRGDETAAKPSLIAFYFRYLVKFFLGWISFLTIHSNPQRKAIHDFAAGTVMVRKT